MAGLRGGSDSVRTQGESAPELGAQIDQPARVVGAEQLALGAVRRGSATMNEEQASARLRHRGLGRRIHTKMEPLPRT